MQICKDEHKYEFSYSGIYQGVEDQTICVLVVHKHIYRNTYFTIMAPVNYKICYL
jgi:hypothetical protein